MRDAYQNQCLPLVLPLSLLSFLFLPVAFFFFNIDLLYFCFYLNWKNYILYKQNQCCFLLLRLNTEVYGTCSGAHIRRTTLDAECMLSSYYKVDVYK